MAVVNSWNVVQMDAYPEKDNEADVVFNVHWELIGSEDTYTGRAYGAIGVEIDAKEPFTPYADLTEAQVIGWVKNALGAEQVAAYEERVEKQIADQQNPQVVVPPLPWASTPFIEETPAA